MRIERGRQINLNTFLGGIGSIFTAVLLYLVTSSLRDLQDSAKTTRDLDKRVAVMQQSLSDIRQEIHEVRDDVKDKHKDHP